MALGPVAVRPRPCLVGGVFAIRDEVFCREPHVLDLLPGGMRVPLDLPAGELYGESIERRGESGMGVALAKLACDGLSRLGGVHAKA